MKRSHRASLSIAIMTAFTMLGFVSTLAGTLAWYAYSTRVVLSLTGTAVRQSVQLEIGVVDPDHYFSNEEIATYNLTRVEEDGTSIVWNKDASGLTSEMLAAYLSSSPYATSELSPVTTLSRSGDDSLTLYESPETCDNDGLDRIYGSADSKNIVCLPFAFKVLNSVDEPVSGQNIWITDAVAASSQHLEKAIRVFVENISGNTRYLFRPASTELEDSGETVVAGRLDLDGDGYYDYSPSNMKEYIYGDITVAGDADVAYLESYGASTGYIDENGTGDTSQDDADRTTFYSRHLVGAKAPNLCSPKVTFNTAEYETKKTVYPVLDGSGNYTGGKPVCVTPSSATKIGYATLTIFLEGWDHVIIDQVVGEQFYLGLTFEINKVQDE